jgi:hypothetical protein
LPSLDRRLHAFRDDLADLALKGRVDAPRFVAGEERQISSASAPLRRAASAEAEQEAEALFGEHMKVFDERDGWAWVQSRRDGYVGYCQSECLSSVLWDSTHVVAVGRTPLFSGPGLKHPVKDFLHMESAIEVLDIEQGYLRTRQGWVFAKHVCPPQQHQRDYVTTALLFLGVPYVWGGRSSYGLDCSGLTQLVMQRAGVEAPRDTDMQERSGLMGAELDLDAPLRRGDLVYWKGHVAIAIDERRVVHATGHHLAVCVEPLEDIDARAQAESGKGITAIRRPGLL